MTFQLNSKSEGASHKTYQEVMHKKYSLTRARVLEAKLKPGIVKAPNETSSVEHRKLTVQEKASGVCKDQL